MVTIKPIPRPCRGCGVGEAQQHIDDCPELRAAVEDSGVSLALCGYTILWCGEEQPCDQPATGWRWYQGHDHEDALDVACYLHENEGGRRMHDLEAKVARVEALAEQWERGYNSPTASSWASVHAEDLRAALDGGS